MLDFIKETISVWELLQATTKPIVLYGMGNAADKIIDWCEEHGVRVQGVFASDEFVRGQVFRGFTVEKYADLKARLGEELLVVLAFASERPEVLAKFRELAAEQEVVAPHLSLFGEDELVSTAWLAKYEAQLADVYARLADDASRQVFACTLNYKLSGKIKYLFACETERLADLRELVRPTQEEVYLDLGAYNGDTIKELGELTDYRWRAVVAVEPDRRNYRKLESYAGELRERGLAVETVEAGIWDEETVLSFSDSGGRQSTFCNASKRETKVTTIDAVSDGRAVSYVKMDVEGAEVQALRGGEQTISTYRPKMFIAAYHYDVDIFRLPLLVWQLCPEYKIYLRKHPYIPAWELNFICMA